MREWPHALYRRSGFSPNEESHLAYDGVKVLYSVPSSSWGSVVCPFVQGVDRCPTYPKLRSALFAVRVCRLGRRVARPAAFLARGKICWRRCSLPATASHNGRKTERSATGRASRSPTTVSGSSEALIGMAKQGRPVPDSIRVMSADKCWSCQTSLAAAHEHCDNCGAPVRLPLVRSLRYWVFASHQIKAHCDAGRLPLSQAHACMNHAKSQIAALRSRLEKERVAMAEVVAEAKPRATVAGRAMRRHGRLDAASAPRPQAAGRPTARTSRQRPRAAAPAVAGNHPRSAHDPMAARARRRAVGGRAGHLAGGRGSVRESRGGCRCLGNRQRGGAGRRLGHDPLLPLSDGRPGHYLAGLSGDAAEPLVLPCQRPDYDRRTIFGWRRWSVACSIWPRRWCCAINCSSTCSPAASP